MCSKHKSEVLAKNGIRYSVASRVEDERMRAPVAGFSGLASSAYTWCISASKSILKCGLLINRDRDVSPKTKTKKKEVKSKRIKLKNNASGKRGLLATFRLFRPQFVIFHLFWPIWRFCDLSSLIPTTFLDALEQKLFNGCTWTCRRTKPTKNIKTDIVDWKRLREKWFAVGNWVKSADVSRILRIFYAYISPFVDAPAAILIPFSSSPCQQNRSVAIVLRFALLWNYYYFFFSESALFLFGLEKSERISPSLWPTSNWGNETFQWFASGFFSFSPFFFWQRIISRKKEFCLLPLRRFGQLLNRCARSSTLINYSNYNFDLRRGIAHEMHKSAVQKLH